jgi:hypothetical protein
LVSAIDVFDCLARTVDTFAACPAVDLRPGANPVGIAGVIRRAGVVVVAHLAELELAIEGPASLGQAALALVSANESCDRLARTRKALAAVAAVDLGAGTNPIGTDIVFGTGITVVARDRVVLVYAAVEVSEFIAGTAIVVCADVSVVTRRVVRRIDASVGLVTRVVGASDSVAAIASAAAHALAARAVVAHRTEETKIAQCVGGLVLRYAH